MHVEAHAKPSAMSYIRLSNAKSFKSCSEDRLRGVEEFPDKDESTLRSLIASSKELEAMRRSEAETYVLSAGRQNNASSRSMRSLYWFVDVLCICIAFKATFICCCSPFDMACGRPLVIKLAISE